MSRELSKDGEEKDDEYTYRKEDGKPENMNYRKRYFYQMNFDIEFPFHDDTVYLAYSRPYPYSEILTRMFEFEK